MREIYYSDGITKVFPGDLVKYKKLFGWKDATVDYVPGISPENSQSNSRAGYLDEVFIKKDNNGYIYGVIVFEDGLLKKDVAFIARNEKESTKKLLPENIDDDCVED